MKSDISLISKPASVNHSSGVVAKEMKIILVLRKSVRRPASRLNAQSARCQQSQVTVKGIFRCIILIPIQTVARNSYMEDAKATPTASKVRKIAKPNVRAQILNNFYFGRL